MNSRRSALLAATLLAAAAPCLAQDDGGRPTFRIDPDPRFGRGGAVRSLRAGGVRMDSADCARLDGEGRIVVAGSRRVRFQDEGVDSVPLVARLLPDGRLDAAFGAGGFVSLPLRGAPTGLDIDSQGRIVVCGGFHSPGPNVPALRLLADGAPDTSFSGDGMADGTANRLLTLRAVHASPSDDSVLALADDDRGTHGVVRFRADGTFDTIFAGDGYADLASYPFDLAVDSTGGALVAMQPPGGVVRLFADGSRDSAFGADGRLVGPHALTLEATSISIDGEGRLVVYGTESALDFHLHRFLADGTPDASFGENGLLAAPSGAPGAAVGPRFAVGAARAADRFVVVSSLDLLGADLESHGDYCLSAQFFDRAAPARVATYLKRDRRPRHGVVRTSATSVLVTDDGRAAYVVGAVNTTRGARSPERGTPLVLRFDLARLKPRRPPALAVAWTETPRATEGAGTSFEGAFRLTNEGRAYEFGVPAAVFLSSDDVLDASDRRLFVQQTGGLAGGASATIRLPGATFDLGASPLGMRLVVALQSEAADPRRRVAVSAPIE